MDYKYVPQGVCPKLIQFSLDENKDVHNVSFLGGCPGNLQAMSKLVEGMPAEKVCSLLEGNRCGLKNTSCADQFTKALKEAMKEMQ